MRFYTNHHRLYCGIDLHARSMYLYILNQEGAIVVWSKTHPALRHLQNSSFAMRMSV